MTRREFTKMAALGPMAAQTRPPMRIIDPHVHVWKRDPRYPWAKETTNPPAEDALPETLLDLMKANGVSHTVIIQVIHYRWDNSYARDVIRRHKGKFLGVCRVNPAVREQAVAYKSQYEQALREELKEKRVVGAVVEINRRPVWADVFASPELFEKYWPKLLSSCVVEAVARRGSTESAATVSAQQFLQRSDAGRAAESRDSAYALERSEAGTTLTYLLSSRVPGLQGALHFTCFERGGPTH